MTNPFDLTGKTALVTGASRGIGRAIALAYAEAGADLALVARSEDSLAELAGEVEGLGRKATVLPCDVTDRAAIQATVAEAIQRLGHVDVAVNNAGGTSFMVPFADIRFPGWEKVFRLNVDSIVHICQVLGPHLLERRAGSVINVASVAALGGTPMLAPYGASKAAVLSLTRTLAMEWAHADVRVNALCPGWTATELNRNLWEDETASKMMTDQIPMGRWGRAEDMVGPALLLASDASTFLTGQALVVDGGQSAG
jgi:NAD(P)-dependent dehydrogenase (short-subunit alcohol dehydrogenase family)